MTNTFEEQVLAPVATMPGKGLQEEQEQGTDDTSFEEDEDFDEDAELDEETDEELDEEEEGA